MKNNGKILLCIMMLSGLLFQGNPDDVPSKNYYVSPAGDDDYDGLSISEPFETIQRACDTATAGDTIYIMAGTYHEAIELTESGSASGYITLQNYDGEKAVIDGTGLGAVCLLHMSDVQYIKVEGLEFCNAYGDWASGIYIEGSGDYIQILNNRIYNINCADMYEAGSNPILVAGTDSASAISHLSIVGNQVYDCTVGWCEGVSIDGNVDDWEVTNNIIHDIGNIGIDAQGHWGTCPNEANDQARNGRIAGNTVYECNSPNEDGAAAGIYVDGAANVLIENNTVYNTQHGLEVGCEQVGHTAEDITVRNNLIYHNTKGGIYFGGYSINEAGSVINSAVLNNTCYQNDTEATGTGEICLEKVDGVRIENNIFYGTSQNVLLTNWLTSEYTKNVTMNYNNWYAPGGADAAQFVWLNEEYSDFNQYVSDSGKDQNSVFIDSLFVNGAVLDEFNYVQDKKVIDFEWAAPSAYYLSNHIQDMLDSPFDGIVFYPGNNRIELFQPDHWSDDSNYIDEQSLSNIDWGRWENNSFLLLWSSDLWENDYWDDEAWDVIAENMGELAEAAKESHCAGILFDSEPYSDSNPWSFTQQNRGHTLEETRQAVRERGQQVMTAWQEHFPDIKILGTFISLCETAEDDLLPYFANGMLDVLNGQATIIDANEQSYWWKDTSEWFDTYNMFKNDASALWGYMDEANETKWKTQVQLARAVYWDELMNDNPTLFQGKQWEHNCYMGLATCDEYVWVYTERMNWFNVPIEYQPMENCVECTGIYPYSQEGLASAISKIKNCDPIGWDISMDYETEECTIDDSIDCTIRLKSASNLLSSASAIPVTIDCGDAALSHIDVYVNSNLIQASDTGEHDILLSHLPSGTYSIIVRGTDAVGHSCTSNMLMIHVE